MSTREQELFEENARLRAALESSQQAMTAQQEARDTSKLLNTPMNWGEELQESVEQLRSDLEEHRQSEIRASIASMPVMVRHDVVDMGATDAAKEAYEGLETDAERRAFLTAMKLVKGV